MLAYIIRNELGTETYFIQQPMVNKIEITMLLHLVFCYIITGLTADCPRKKILLNEYIPY